VKTFPIKKRINTELFIDWKWVGRKSWWEITVVGVKTAAACLGRLTIN